MTSVSPSLDLAQSFSTCVLLAGEKAGEESSPEEISSGLHSPQRKPKIPVILFEKRLGAES